MWTERRCPSKRRLRPERLPSSSRGDAEDENRDLDPATAGFAAVIYGHSHRPSIETRDGVLWLNPGSAGPRRFDLPVSVARVRVAGREVSAEIVRLEI